jgi:hypothetical protein
MKNNLTLCCKFAPHLELLLCVHICKADNKINSPLLKFSAINLITSVEWRNLQMIFWPASKLWREMFVMSYELTNHGRTLIISLGHYQKVEGHWIILKHCSNDNESPNVCRCTQSFVGLLDPQCKAQHAVTYNNITCITTKVQMSSSSGKMLYTLKIQWLKSEWPSTKQLLVKERIYIYIFGVMSNSTATHIWSDLIWLNLVRFMTGKALGLNSENYFCITPGHKSQDEF